MLPVEAIFSLTPFPRLGTGERPPDPELEGDGSYVIGGHLGIAPNAWLASLRADDSLRWSASYRSRPHANGVDFTTLTGLAAIPDGVLACGHMEPPGVDPAEQLQTDPAAVFGELLTD
jgi:hypothetical protein